LPIDLRQSWSPDDHDHGRLTAMMIELTSSFHRLENPASRNRPVKKAVSEDTSTDFDLNGRRASDLRRSAQVAFSIRRDVDPHQQTARPRKNRGQSEQEVRTMVRVAVITGASRGIGAATALVLAKHGYRVVVNYRSSAREAEEVVTTIAAAGGEAVAIKADVTVSNDVTAMVDEIDRRWGRTDVLVHNAMTPFAVTSFAELSWEQLGGKLESELHAAFLTTKAVVPGMISRRYGRLVYLSTGLSRRARDGMITLGTAKAALDQFVRYIALELAPHGITANLVAPATVEGTRVTKQFTIERLREFAAATPMRRLTRPDDVAKRWRSLQVRIPVSRPATTCRSTGAWPWIERGGRAQFRKVGERMFRQCTRLI
jgi:3-oxoacyl-[acyl-carrier protein] reductase